MSWTWLMSHAYDMIWWLHDNVFNDYIERMAIHFSWLFNQTASFYGAGDTHCHCHWHWQESYVHWQTCAATVVNYLTNRNRILSARTFDRWYLCLWPCGTIVYTCPGLSWAGGIGSAYLSQIKRNINKPSATGPITHNSLGCGNVISSSFFKTSHVIFAGNQKVSFQNHNPSSSNILSSLFTDSLASLAQISDNEAVAWLPVSGLFNFAAIAKGVDRVYI